MGIQMLLIEIIILWIVVFIWLYLDKRRRASKPYLHYILWTIGEIFLMFIIFNSALRFMTMKILCEGCDDIFGLSFQIFWYTVWLLFIGIFDYFYFQKSNKYEIIIWIIITLFYVYSLGDILIQEILWQLSTNV